MTEDEDEVWVTPPTMRRVIGTVMEWQPMETAEHLKSDPKKSNLALLWGRYWSDSQGWMTDPLVGQWVASRNRWEVWGPGCAFGIRPTHWMPLPKPPSK